MVTDADRSPRSPEYIGRFAPSPTGPLHFGSLIAAAGSYLRARQANGRWLLRIEDIDPPREVPGAAALILEALECCGFQWDGPVVYQSQRLDVYREALNELAERTYLCNCSRSKISREAQRLNLPPGRYPGTCRDRGLLLSDDGAIRVRCDERPGFSDLLQGTFEPAAGIDDFVLWRRDELPSYQLAVTVDDAAQSVTEVVRGCDLLDTTPRQLHLIRCLDLPAPRFVHLPVAVNAEGQKLSKQTGASAIDPGRPGPALCAALSALGLACPPALEGESVHNIWQWAFEEWSYKSLKSIKTVPDVDHR